MGFGFLVYEVVIEFKEFFGFFGFYRFEFKLGSGEWNGVFELEYLGFFVVLEMLGISLNGREERSRESRS